MKWSVKDFVALVELPVWSRYTSCDKVLLWFLHNHISDIFAFLYYLLLCRCDGTATKDPCADLFANETLKTSSVCTQLSAKVLPLTCSSPDDTGAADSDVTCTMGSADSVCSVLALLENRCTDMGCNHTAATCSSAVHLFAFTTISLGIIGVAAVIAVMI